MLAKRPSLTGFIAAVYGVLDSREAISSERIAELLRKTGWSETVASIENTERILKELSERGLVELSAA